MHAPCNDPCDFLRDPDPTPALKTHRNWIGPCEKKLFRIHFLDIHKKSYKMFLLFISMNLDPLQKSSSDPDPQCY